VRHHVPEQVVRDVGHGDRIGAGVDLIAVLVLRVGIQLLLRFPFSHTVLQCVKSGSSAALVVEFAQRGQAQPLACCPYLHLAEGVEFAHVVGGATVGRVEPAQEHPTLPQPLQQHLAVMGALVRGGSGVGVALDPLLALV